MELNDTRSIDKRQITLTPRAFEYKLEKLQEERQVKIRKIKGAIREIKDLKQSAENAEKIRLLGEHKRRSWCNMRTFVNQTQSLLSHFLVECVGEGPV